jgi:hypothetical protein
MKIARSTTIGTPFRDRTVVDTAVLANVASS